MPDEMCGNSFEAPPTAARCRYGYIGQCTRAPLDHHAILTSIYQAESMERCVETRVNVSAGGLLQR